jgi:hypothetical protein
MHFQWTHGLDVNVSQGIRGANKQALLETEIPSDRHYLEIRQKTARKVVRRKKKVHEQTAKLEAQRMWRLNHKKN